MPVPTNSAEIKLGGIDLSKKLLFDALLRGPKLDSMVSAVATVGTASTLIVGTDNIRAYTVIQNIGDEDIDIAFGEAAVADQGLKLDSHGGWYVIGWHNLWTGAVYGICSVIQSVNVVNGRV